MAGVRLADTLGCFAVAGEMGRGQPKGHVPHVRSVAMDIAAELGLPAETRRDVFHTAILVRAGCIAGASEAALFLLCDELAVQRDICMCDPSHEIEVMKILLRHAGSGTGAAMRARSLLKLATGGEKVFREMEAGCSDVGSRIATRLGLPEAAREALFHICESWYGKGPHRVAGDSIPLIADREDVNDLQVVPRCRPHRSGLAGSPTAVGKIPIGRSWSGCRKP